MYPKYVVDLRCILGSMHNTKSFPDIPAIVMGKLASQINNRKVLGCSKLEKMHDKIIGTFTECEHYALSWLFPD